MLNLEISTTSGRTHCFFSAFAIEWLLAGAVSVCAKSGFFKEEYLK